MRSYHAVDTDKSVFCNFPRSRSPSVQLVRGFHNPDLESGLPEVEPERELELELILHGNIFFSVIDSRTSLKSKPRASCHGNYTPSQSYSRPSGQGGTPKPGLVSAQTDDGWDGHRSTLSQSSGTPLANRQMENTRTVLAQLDQNQIMD